MSQTDFAESQSVDLHMCRWKWCSDTFLSKSELIHHVLDHHVQNSVPCSRREYALSRKIEEGEGESLSFPHAENAGSKTQGNIVANHQLDPIINSSLPSPPASTPPNLSPIPPPALLPFPRYHFDDEYRTFAALSSPSPSPAAQQIPVSPTFSSMIEDAVAPKSRSSHLVSRVSQSSQESASSSESCDVVEQQLTQNEDLDAPASSPTYSNWLSGNDCADHLPSSHSHLPQLRMSDTGPNSPVSPSDAISFQRPAQSWYQTRTPKKKRSSRGSKTSVAAQSPPSHNASPVSPSLDFQLGSVEVIPSQKSGGADSASQGDGFSAIPSQSIAPLQTQAPYWSQSPVE
ncbi:hypothetical protein IW261DRAFT_1434542 [Armillaria novae-zelandiae]|uniref:C2H2-type domain-containing protein n=1 Tax=Armillaria novae-zelandiae TaxID=153914 RepID=A0AA39TIS4_9AGAR|nr:hypothetical protein IW261DRAFT_1434542 [Armillaria novae-zelandiae]